MTWGVNAWWWGAVLGCCVSLGGVSVGQEEVEADERSEEFAEALRLVTERDSAFAARLLQAIEQHEDEVVEEIFEYAEYLREMDELREEDPEHYALLVEQERLEAEVDVQVERWLDAEDPTEVAAVDEQLDTLLGEWFELRQELRRIDLAELESELVALRDRVTESEQDPESFRQEWLERFLHDESEGSELVDALHAEPHVVVLEGRVMNWWEDADPELFEQMVELREDDPREYWMALAEELEEDGDAEELAREESADSFDLECAALEARREVIRLLASLRKREGGIPGNLDDPELQAQVETVCHYDRILARADVEAITFELLEQRELLTWRDQRKASIIELQRARIFGREELFEW